MPVWVCALVRMSGHLCSSPVVPSPGAPGAARRATGRACRTHVQEGLYCDFVILRRGAASWNFLGGVELELGSSQRAEKSYKPQLSRVTLHGTITLSKGCLAVIKTFADRETESLFCDGCARKLPRDIWSRALRKLDMIDNAYAVDDLRVPPGNRLHRLQGDRFGLYSISINDQWRICFSFREENAYDVEICDYH